MDQQSIPKDNVKTGGRAKKPRIEIPPVVPDTPIDFADPFDFESTNSRPDQKENSGTVGSSTVSNEITPEEVKEIAPKKNKFFKSRNLFDSLKNGPTFNNDSILYKDDAITNVNAVQPAADNIYSKEPISSSDHNIRCVSDLSADIDIQHVSDAKLDPAPSEPPPQGVSTIKTKNSSSVENAMSSDNLNFNSDSDSNTNKQSVVTGINDPTGFTIDIELKPASVDDDSSKDVKITPSNSSTSMEGTKKPVKKFFTNRHNKSSSSPAKVG